MISWTIRGQTQPHLGRKIRLRSKFMVHKGNIIFLLQFQVRKLPIKIQFQQTYLVLLNKEHPHMHPHAQAANMFCILR